MPSSLTLRELDTQARRRSSYLLRQWAHLTGETGYSSSSIWQSPTAVDGTRTISPKRRRAWKDVPPEQGKRYMYLSGMAERHWTTPADPARKSGRLDREIGSGNGLRDGSPIYYRLNPSFVEWIMGWEHGATSLRRIG